MPRVPRCRHPGEGRLGMGPLPAPAHPTAVPSLAWCFPTLHPHPCRGWSRLHTGTRRRRRGDSGNPRDAGTMVTLGTLQLPPSPGE